MKRIIIATLGVVVMLAALLTGGAATADKPESVTFCHVAGLADDPANTVTLTLPWVAVYGQAGHFNEDGTDRAGHEQDYLGACDEDPPPVEVVIDASVTAAYTDPTCEVGQSVTFTAVNATFDNGLTTLTFGPGPLPANETINVTADEGHAFYNDSPEGSPEATTAHSVLSGPFAAEHCDEPEVEEPEEEEPVRPPGPFAPNLPTPEVPSTDPPQQVKQDPPVHSVNEETYCLADALVVESRSPNGDTSKRTINGHPDCAPEQGEVFNEEGF